MTGYPYRDVPLRPNIFGLLALDLFPGQSVKRSELASAVQDYHAKNGGAPSPQPLDATAKKALALLVRKGLAESVDGGFGLWRLSGAEGVAEARLHDQVAGQDIDRYDFEGILLTPSLFGRLALRLFGGQIAKRMDVVRTVNEFHISQGGLPPKMSAIQVGKDALTKLSRDGLAESVVGGFGMWRFSVSEDTVDTPDDESDDEQDMEWIEAGDSTSVNYVYVYDLPTYAAHAEAMGMGRWPHKIGFTKVTPEARIAAQVGTALPEHPRIVLTFAHEKAGLLERALHAILELRGQKVTGPGSEWFATNPAEIQAWVDVILSSVQQPSADSELRVVDGGRSGP